MNGYLFTGFPGFICNQLIKEVMKFNDNKGVIYTLVLPQLKEMATQEREKIVQALGIDEEQFIIIEGDITHDSLKIPESYITQIAPNITHVFHLAAIYDLAVPKDLAYKVNVVGTKNVNDFVRKLPNIQRYIYFSTAYVAGKRDGMLYENELILPPSFKNDYEQTKYEAEILVEELKQHVPTTIIRPGIVKGHSKTGETIKFDGPYFILNFFDRLRFMPIIPYLGKSESVINLVPVDYIIESTVYLGFNEIAANKTYHLTDPNPYKVTEVYRMLMKELLNKEPVGTLPLGLAKSGLAVKPLRRYLRAEGEALDYFTWKGQFDCSQAQQDLKGSGIVCPDFKDGVPSMVAFYVKNKENPGYQIKII